MVEVKVEVVVVQEEVVEVLAEVVLEAVDVVAHLGEDVEAQDVEA